MIKRTLCAILTAVFLSVLCIPCAATGTERAYPGFSDVPEGSASCEAVKLCYERGLMNGASDTAFNPQGKLTVAQLVVLAARLYDLQNGGDGTLPPDLPDLSQSYLRFYGEDGSLIASCSRVWELPACNLFGDPYFAVTAEEDADLPETCTLEMGFEGYGTIRRYEGARETHPAAGGVMHQGLVGTGYRFTGFTDADIGRISPLPREELVEHLKEAWWFPAAFYLATQAGIGIEGELDYRANSGNHEDYDPLTRFSQDHASRALFAWLVDRTAGDLPVLNETVSVPDMDPYETQDGEAILRLYQAGVLTGVDKAGNFHGAGELTRAQAAIMLARLLEPSLRVKTS